MTFIPSPQQAAFLNWVSTGTGSCVLEAVAGAGKTTTLLEAVDRTSGGVAILAYNKKIAEEIKAKLQKRGVDWKTAEAGTVHSFGLRAYRKTFPKVQIEARKVENLIAQASIPLPSTHVLRLFSGIVTKLVSFAKQRALGVIGSIDDTSAWFDIAQHFDVAFDDEDAQERLGEIIAAAIGILKASNAQTDIVDFDDLVYLPVFLRLNFWRYRWVFVDEAQDTNPARRALVRALLAPGGRCVAVGDRHQAIYGFTGADADSLDLIRRDFNAIELPLTVTYRCPQSVVAFAQKWVSHIEAHESAPEGSVRSIDAAELLQQNDLTAGTAILCRNTKPLVELAFRLIRSRIGCKVEGRDIGNGLTKLATKWKRVTTLHGLEQALDKWSAAQITKALAQKNEQRAQTIEDQVETLKTIIADCRTRKQDSIKAVTDAIGEIFGDNVEHLLVLSTIHKSKGREWKTVYWLDRAGTVPSKYARQDWQIEQETNLCYVAATRAQETLIEVVVGP